MLLRCELTVPVKDAQPHSGPGAAIVGGGVALIDIIGRIALVGGMSGLGVTPPAQAGLCI